MEGGGGGGGGGEEGEGEGEGGKSPLVTSSFYSVKLCSIDFGTENLWQYGAKLH